MSCLGTNINQIKDNVKQGVQDILNQNGGTLNSDGTVVLGNTQILDIANFIGETFNTTDGTIETSPWLVERDGKVYYQFPKNVESIVEKAIENKKEKEQLEKEMIAEIAIENELAEEQLITEKDDAFEDLLFAPTLIRFDSEEVTQIIKESKNNLDKNKGVDFKVWLQQKQALLEDVKKNFENFKRTETKGTDYNRKTVLEYQKVILELEKTVDDLAKTEISFEDVYKDVFDELSYLEGVVSKMDVLDVDMYSLERRLDILSKLFLNKTFNGVDLDKETKDSNVFIVYDDELMDVRDRITKLLDEYDKKSFNKIASLMQDNAFLQELKRQNKVEVTNPETGELYTGDEAIDFLIQVIEDVRVETAGTSWGAKILLGANWNGIFGQLARITRDVYIREEQGKVRSFENVIQENLGAFRKSGLTVDVFAGRDEYGVKNGFLAHKFSDKWFKYLALKSKSRRTFDKIIDEKQKSISYRNLMDKMYENEIVIDFTKIKTIKDRFSGSFLYKEGFTHSDDTMSEYEQKIRDTLGNYLFDEKIREQKQLLEDYEIFYTNNNNEFEEEVSSVNPLSFLKNYQSSSYGKMKDGLYLMPDFVVSIPLDKRKVKKGRDIVDVDTGLYSQNFKKIEDNKAAFNIWQAIETAYRERINPELKESGFFVSDSGLDIAMVEDVLKSAMTSSLDIKKKSLVYARHLWDKIKSMAAPVYRAGQGAMDVKINYSHTLKYQTNQMYDFLKSNTLENLIKIASQEKILSLDEEFNNKTILDSDGIKRIKDNIAVLEKDMDNALDPYVYKATKKRLESYKKSTRESLARSIANSRVYAHANMDILNVTQSLDHAAALSRGNRKALGSVRLLKNYLENAKERAEDAGNSKVEKRLEKTVQFFNSWIDTNILDNINSKELDILQKFLMVSKQVKDKKGKAIIGKRYTKTEREMIDFFNNEIKNIDDKESFAFTEGDTTYEKMGDNFSKSYLLDGITVKKLIEKAEFEEHYASYIGEKISKMGSELTIGSLISGYIRVAAFKVLALNVPAGTMNRAFGVAINDTISTSGRYGITRDQLQKARNAMAMSNIDKFLREDVGPRIGLKRGTRAEHIALNMKTLKLFANSFGLIQNKLNEISGLKDVMNKEGFSAMDWAVNYAEWRNQGELLLCEAMNHSLEYEDENGNIVQVPIYDGDTESWVYKPGTLILKDEYRTPENIRIWENFAISKGGKNPFLPLLFNAQANIERSQGNYNDSDKPMIMASQVGRGFLMFKRFMAEQFANQYGRIEYDLIKGGKTFEGRYRRLLKYAPVAGTLFGTIGLGLFGPIGLLVTAPTATAVSLIVSKAHFKEQTRQYEQITLSLAEQALLSLKALKELIIRVIGKPLNVVVRSVEMTSKEKGKKARAYYQEKFDKWTTDEKFNALMGEEKRKILSESVEDVANLYYSIGVTLALTTFTRLVGELITGADDDDDDETYKKKMKEIERLCNLFVNRYGFFTSDFTRSFDPIAFSDEVEPVLANNIKTAIRAVKKGSRWVKGEGDFKPFLSDVVRATPSFIPNQVANTFLSDTKKFWGDSRIYDKPWWYPVSGSQEIKAKKAITYQKKKLTEDMVDIYKKKFKEELKSMPQEFQDSYSTSKFDRNIKLGKLANEAAKKEKRKRYTRMSQERFDEFYIRVDLKAEREKWKDGEIRPKYTFKEMLKWSKERDQKREKDRAKYEREFVE